jgi:ParB family chromosome partitioning protein
MSTLGKGLESLIPPTSGKNNGNGAAQDSPQPAPEEKLLPPGDVLPEIQAPPEEQLLPPAQQPDLQAIATQYSARPASKSRSESVFYLEVDKIHPNRQQPRRHFDEEAIAGLAASIREVGILQPLVVTKVETEVPGGTEVEYELIAGERRLLAARMAGLERVPAIVRTVDLAHDRLQLAVIENIQRENLNPLETARAFARLQDEFRLTQREIAMRLGKSREVVANTMRLLDLPSYIQEAIGKGQMSESHGRLLLGIEDPAAQQALFHDLMNQHMTTRELRRRTAFLKKKNEPNVPAEAVPPEIKQFEEKLASALAAPVKIESHGTGGKITIDFFSSEELQAILRRLGDTEE